MGNVWSGHCDGSNWIPPQNVPKNLSLGSQNNSGTNIKNQNIPTINYDTIDLTKCNYSPDLKNTNVNLSNYQEIANIYKYGNITVNNLTVNNSCNLIPRGIIIAWFNKTIPDGWALCDGTNCTPDLRGRAIYGFDSKSNKNKIGQKGGEETHLLTIGEIPSHSHPYTINSNQAGFLTSAAGASKNWSNGKNTNSSNNFSYINDSKNLSHNNMPPYVACSYIMKL